MTVSNVVKKLKKAARVILVGAPGVGKGTQSDRLIHRYTQLSSISTGDILRDNVQNSTKLGAQADYFMRSGKLVPDPLILELILSELTKRNFIHTKKSNEEIVSALSRGNGSGSVEPSNDPNTSFILDGFPRTAIQAQALSHLLPMNLVFHLVTPIEIILSRVSNRWIHTASGRVYNVGFNDPKEPGLDDVTGEPLVQREDDSEATWRKRLETFDKTSQPLLDFYRRKDPDMVVEVRGDCSDDISPLLYQEMEKRFGS